MCRGELRLGAMVDDAEPQEPEKRSDVIAVASLVVITAGASYGISYAFDAARAGTPSAGVGIAVTYFVLTMTALVYGARAHLLKRWLVPASGDVTRGFVCALVLFACAFGVVKLMTMHGSPRAAWIARLDLQLGDTKPLREHQAIVGGLILMMASFEEIVWRGWAKSLLDVLVGPRFGWIAAGVLYALAHTATLWALADTTVGTNPLVVIAALGAGLLWSGMVRVFGGRLIPSIVSHALFDWAVLMMFRLWGPSV